MPPARAPDPAALVDRQLARDRARTAWFPPLLARKLERMTSSPLLFLRGAAALFYEVLAAEPELASGPPGEGWICGDLHLENFGAFRPEPSAEEGRSEKRVVVFDLNDFDSAVIGPWRLDLVRLGTSLLLGARDLGTSGMVALELLDHLFAAWSAGVFDGEPLPDPPAPIQTLLSQVRERTRLDFLEDRTVVEGETRRFARGPRYADLPPDVVAAVPAAFAAYTDELAPAEPGAFDLLDCALRIAGVGGLGDLRVAILVAGKGGPDGARVFELKEQRESAAALVTGPPELTPAPRVVAAFRAALARPPRDLGTTTLGPRSLLGRRLAPQEDKLDMADLPAASLPALAAYLGALTGAAHLRGASNPLPPRWSPSDLATLRAHSIRLAGLHEAMYLVLCDRVAREA